MPAVDYRTHHLLPRLRESPKAAAGYIAASLTDNADYPESIALAFQDVIEAYQLPIDVSMKADTEHQRLQSAVVDACSVYCASVLDMEDNGKPKGVSYDEWHVQHCAKQTAMIDAYKALIAFEAEHKIGVE